MQGNNIGLISQNSKSKVTKELRDKAINQLDDIINSMPSEISQFVNEAFIHKRIPKEYLFSSILYAFSNAPGLAVNINCMNYTNYANLNFVIVGSRGDIKSPAMEMACYPLKLKDDENYRVYKKQLSESQNNDFTTENIGPIKRKMFLIQNATVESAMYDHLNNPYSIGVYVDELSYMIEKMANKNSNEGAVWRVFWLQGNTNKHIDVSRKTSDSYRLDKSYPTLLGSIQNEFVPKMFENGNLESGFIDRLLFTNKLTGNDKISKSKMPIEVTSNYRKSLDNLITYRENIEGDSKNYTVVLSRGAEDRIYKYSQSLLDNQKLVIDITKEYMSKMLITIHKLVLLVHLISQSFDKRKFTKELISLAKTNNIPQKDVVALTGMSKGHISRLWNRNETGN